MRIKYLPQDNEARINGGICRYNRVPYMINLISQTQASLTPIYRKKNVDAIVVELNDERLDISSPSLGWINHKNGSIYVVRRPERNYKQTLKTQHLSGYTIGNYQIDGTAVQGYLYTYEGERMLMGEYPTIEDAVKRLSAVTSDGRKVTSSVAISRNVCLAEIKGGTTKFEVFYKIESMGIFDTTTNVVTIPNGELSWIASKYLESFPWRVE